MDENLKNALKAHDLYWTSYINGQTDIVESLLDENYQQIGSVEEEVFFNKKDAIGFVKKTIDQVSGKVEIRNRVTKSEKLSGYILINEFFDLYVKTDENWFFYSKFRTSSLMQQKADGWKLVHQHSSMPDSKAEEGENIAIEKINQENLELKNAIKRRTIELEHKNRELEIEAALERVRAKAMAMRKSDELTDVAVVLFKELKKVGIEPRRCGFAIKQPEGPVWQFWHTTKDGQAIEKAGRLSEEQVPFFKDVFTAWKDGEVESHTSTFSGAELDHVIHFLIERTEVNLPDAETEVQQGIYPTQVCFNFFFFKHGSLLAHTLQPLKEENRKVLERFARIFEQTYTRFLDLKKAEAQAREAQIEAALERVRSRTIGMQRSDELQKAAALMFQQIKSLGVDIMGCGFNIWDDDRKEATAWMSGMERIQPPFKTSSSRDIFLRIFEAAQRGDSLFVEEQAGEELIEHYKYMASIPVFKKILDNLAEKGLSAPSFQIMHCAFFSQGYLMFITHEPASNDYDIFKRFAKVFEQTYIRFLDLQKAEEQARKAEIEASLERVRTKAMAMHSSKDIESATAVVFNELSRLGIDMERCGISLMNETPIGEIWSTPLSQESKEVVNVVTGYLDFGIHPILQQSYRDWREKKEFSAYKLVGDEVREYYAKLEKQPEYKFPKVANYPDQQILNTFYFKEGGIFAFTVDELSAEAKDIIQKFTKVFAQTYTRFLDIQKAEEQAREATKQASLDRVRGEIASMRSAKDLEIITPLVWNELNTLGIPFIRCGVFIVHEEEEEVEVYLSKPDGTSLAVMHLSFGSSDLVNQTVDAWRNNSVHTQHWTQEEFLDWGRSMVEQGQVRDLKSYRGAEAPPESLNLHFIPFKQGMLYVGSTNPLDEDEIDLAASLAKAFSIAYARYEDFVKLEKAKKSIEVALTELKATQSQLVQQEKLASLGQLTAGIAHEIKNPLNFVNNFSDLSTELIQEVREEIESVRAIHELPLQDVFDILDDIENNLRKIHEHGTRADGIVKSMLQHSRGGDGKMEPTDLNALIKEYVNLAFHGMRASKEPINVDIDLQLDQDIGEIPLIAEDFSRVILNLCNNAFDAMRSLGAERSAQGESYEPKLTVKTHRNDQSVTIEIQDNGPGIPDDIKDKILQPFFTTKKGTAGTGLGLSITNDIIKAHGGNIDIHSSGTGSSFNIFIPSS